MMLNGVNRETKENQTRIEYLQSEIELLKEGLIKMKKQPIKTSKEATTMKKLSKDAIEHLIKNPKNGFTPEMIKAIHDSNRDEKPGEKERKESHITLRWYMVGTTIVQAILGYISYLKLQSVLELVRFFLPIP